MNPLDKAGAYAIQEHGDKIVSEISGSFSNVVGLPMEQLADGIERLDLILRRQPLHGTSNATVHKLLPNHCLLDTTS